MADFLNRLAARALGATPLAEPVIPTRFSSGPEQSAFLVSEPPIPSPHPFFETSPETSEDRPRPHRDTHTERPAAPFQDLDEGPHQPLSQRPHGFHPQPAPPPFAERETVQPSPERAGVRKQHLAAAMNPNLEEERPSAHKSQAISPAPVPFAEPQPAPRLTPLVEPKHSPVLQRPELAQSFRPAPPTVHVSIGRIEVRAEIASPMPTASAQRRRPSTLSLDQFLKQAGRGER